MKKISFLFILGFFFSLEIMSSIVLTQFIVSDLVRWFSIGVGVVGFVLSLFAVILDLPKFHSFFKITDWIGYTFFGVYLLECVVALFVFIYKKLGEPLGESGSVPIIFLGILTVIALWNGYRFPKMTKHEKSILLNDRDASGKIINEKKTTIKIIQLSDVHVGMLHLREKWLKKVVEKINGEKPDVVVITGDLVESPYEIIQEELNSLREVIAPLGRFYITGNHEYFYGGDIWERKMESLGWTPLHSDSKTVIKDKVNILFSGVPDFTGAGMSPPAEINFKKALSPKNEKDKDFEIDYKILLIHQPSEIKKIDSKHKPHLILTGHTHGGQIFPFHFLVRMVQPVVSGWKKMNDMDLFVHQGTGFWGPPMRLGTRAEIAVIELKFNS